MKLLLFLTLASGCRVGQQSLWHGTLGRDASLFLLKRNQPLGRFRCDLLTRRSSTHAVVAARYALRKKDAYSIIQFRGEYASMFVCRVINETSHDIVSVLSTSESTPLIALQNAMRWHEGAYPEVCIAVALSVLIGTRE